MRVGARPGGHAGVERGQSFRSTGSVRLPRVARGAFDRVVVFTSVRTPLAREVLRTLVEYDEAPAWFAESEIVTWEGALKDLAFVEGANIERVTLLDDQERYVVPAQRGQWVAIAEWDAP